MSAWLVRRVGWAIFTIWACVSLTFLVYNVLPEDPARVIAGPQARPQDVERIRQQLGIDRPLGERYVRFWRELVKVGAPPPEEKPDATLRLGPVRIDLGESYLKRKPVVALLAKALPATLLLGALAMLIEVLVGTLAGVVAAARRGRWLDWTTVSVTLLGISAPTFLTGLLLQHLLAREANLFPLDGYGATVAERLHAAALPALTLGLYGAAYYTRLVRDEMIGLFSQDWIRTARAKGMSRARVIGVHALRNALMPLVTVVGLNLGSVVGGAIVTEKIFRWPGVGSLSVDAIVERDGPVIMGVVILLSTVVVFSNLLVDLSYAVLDPRVRKR